MSKRTPIVELYKDIRTAMILQALFRAFNRARLRGD